MMSSNGTMRGIASEEHACVAPLNLEPTGFVVLGRRGFGLALRRCGIGIIALRRFLFLAGVQLGCARRGGIASLRLRDLPAKTELPLPSLVATVR